MALHYSTPEPVDSDIVRRTKIAMGYFTNSIAEAKGNNVGRFMRMLTEDMLAESAMVPPEILEFYMKQAAAVLYWTATGQNIVNMPMPQDFTSAIPRELISENPKAISPPQFSSSDLYIWIYTWLLR